MSKRVFTQVFGVVGAIIEKDGKFLLAREYQGKGPDHGKWSHPAGWIDVGENPINAAGREAEEESGFKFQPTHLLGVYSLVRKDLQGEYGTSPHPIKLIFTGKISGKQQSLHDDVTETKWFTAKQILDMDNDTLRDVDIKQMIKDYQAGNRHPLNVITHIIQTG